MDMGYTHTHTHTHTRAHTHTNTHAYVRTHTDTHTHTRTHARTHTHTHTHTQTHTHTHTCQVGREGRPEHGHRWGDWWLEQEVLRERGDHLGRGQGRSGRRESRVFGIITICGSVIGTPC